MVNPTLPAPDQVKSLCAPEAHEFVTLTSELIHSAATNYGGFTKKQLAVFGIVYPPRHGWLRKLVGKTVTQEQWGAFVANRNQRAKGQKAQTLMFSNQEGETLTLPTRLSLARLENRGITLRSVKVKESIYVRDV